MPALDLSGFRSTRLERRPFQYLVVPGFIRSEALEAINADYPRVEQVGSFPVGDLTFGPAFQALLAELGGPEMKAAVEGKFGIDLGGRPMTVTVRGRCGTRDGNIHTDARSKLITVLLYMNSRWEETGGRLRLLRSADNLDDVLVEVPPVEGTLVAFRRSDNSYHGHKPFIGQRRVIQVNWVTDRLTQRREMMKHRMSAWVKRILSLFSKSRPVEADAPMM